MKAGLRKGGAGAQWEPLEGLAQGWLRPEQASLFSFISQSNKKACAKRTSLLGSRRDGSVQKAFQAQAGDKGVVRETYLPCSRYGTHHEVLQYQARDCGSHFSP